MGANTSTVPMVEPVMVASTLVRIQNTKIRMKGLMLLPSIPATVSPTRLVSPVTPRASATPITPADMRMMGAPRLLQISLKVIILVSSSTHTAVATTAYPWSPM